MNFDVHIDDITYSIVFCNYLFQK